MELRFTNSKTRSKEIFVPIDPQNVRIYVCGPTVYDRAHVGNARPAIVFDTLFRLMRHVYGAQHVVYARNFTDVDDKINAKSADTGRPISDITEETIGWYLSDMAAVGVMEPTHMPRATDYMMPMIQMIEGLIEKGHAYAAQGHVLFSVSSYDQYGALSGRSTDDMIAGARVEVAPYKRDPMDFVLWKPADAATPGWDSPWGRGRPGWHIECSAMSRDLFGPQFDIHGGGNDLLFPHHENEMAQSCCADPDAGFANVWLHNEMLQVEGKKMSKSLGNFFTVRDLLDQGVAGEVIRYVMLSTHYRKPMDWTQAKADQAAVTLRNWRALTQGATEIGPDEDVVALLGDDLNTAGALARLHAMAKAIASNPQKDCTIEKGVLLSSARLMGLLTPELGGWEKAGPDLTDLADRLVALRAQAMETKDFSGVDALKSALVAAGVEVRMSKAGVELAPAAGFDPSKLEDLA